MSSIRQAVVYAMIFSCATTIGYDSGYLNGVLGSSDFIERYGWSDDGGQTKYLTPYTRAMFSSLLIVGTFSGCFINALLTNRIGRRGCLFVAAVCYAVGVILQTVGIASAGFIVGRVLLGIAIGLISNSIPSYLMECSSGTNRGRFMACYLQFLTSGNVLACGINYGTSGYSDSRSWRVTIGFQLLFAITILLGACYCPESPSVLLLWNREEDTRRSFGILKNARPDSEEVNMAMEELQKTLAEQNAMGQVRIVECFQGSNLRRTLLGLAMAFFTIATGITFWFGYGTTFFIVAGVSNSYLISLILAIVNCVFTAPSLHLVERLGRRRLLIWGGIIMGVTQILTGAIHSAAPNSNASKNMLVAGAVIFIAAYAPSWGVGGWLLMVEPFSNRLRVHQTAVVLSFYWIITWLVGFVTPYMVDSTAGDLGVNVAYIWAGLGIISLVWAYFCVPELAGLSKSEVDTLFETRVPSRKSVAWKKQLRTIDSNEVSVVTTSFTQKCDESMEV